MRNVSMVFEFFFHENEIQSLFFEIELFSLGIENQISKLIYEETNKNVVKLCETFYFALIKVTSVMSMIPKLLFIIYMYFTTENGVYELPFRMW